MGQLEMNTLHKKNECTFNWFGFTVSLQ